MTLWGVKMKIKIMPVSVMICAFALVLCIVPGILQGAKITTFEGGLSDVTVTITSKGYDSSTVLKIPNNSTVTGAKMKMMGLPDGSGSYPWNVSVDFGADKKAEYRYAGQGVGPWGHQFIFNDNKPTKDIMFYPGALENTTAKVRLPRTATVTSATADIRQFNIPNYGFKMAPANGDGTTTFTYPYLYQSDYSSSYCPILTVTWSTGSYTSPTTSALKDAMTTSTFPTSNYGSYTYLIFYYASNGWVEFDLSSIPAGTQITSATMSIYVSYSGGTKDIGLFWAKSSWTESTITNNNMPAVFPQYATHQTTTGYQTITFDMKNIVQQWIGANPSNVKLDVGDDNSYEYTGSGIMSGGAKVTTPDLAAAINSKLTTAPVKLTDSYGNEWVDIPLSVSSSTAGCISIEKLDIKYDYAATIDLQSQSNLTNTLNALVPDGLSAPESGDFSIPINISSSAPGKIKLFDVDIDYTPPNYRPTGSAIPDQAIDEDMPNAALVDLSAYFLDDRDDPKAMKYKVSSNSNDDYVTVAINPDGYHLSATPAADWNGMTNVRVTCTDSGGKGIYSNYFNITVNPVNDEPTTVSQIGALSMDEGYTQTVLELGKAQTSYFSDIDSTRFYYFAVVDPLSEYTDEQLSAQILDLSDTLHGLQLSAKGDWNTEKTSPVKVRIACDDDDVLDTPPTCYQDLDVSVFPVNDAPVWKPIADITLDEDTVLETPIELIDYVSDIESPAAEMKFRIYSNTNASKIDAKVEGTTLSITPIPDYDGSTKVTLEVSDGENKTYTSFWVYMNPKNDIPTVALTTPTEGTTIKSAMTAMGTATDIEKALQKVEVRVDTGSWQTAEGTYMWSYELDPTTLTKGDHTFAVRSFDGTDYSPEVSVKFKVTTGTTPGNALPTVTVTAPKNGAGPLSGLVTITGKASDQDGSVSKVELTIQNKTFVAEGTTAWSYKWNTPTTSRYGLNITVKAVAYDNKNDPSVPASIYVTVVNSDSDGDKMPDWYEEQYPGKLDPKVDDAQSDPDKDGYINYDEFAGGTDPTNKDDYPGKKITTTDDKTDNSYVLYILIAVMAIVVLVIMVIVILTVMTMIKKKKALEEQDKAETPAPVATPTAISAQAQPIPMATASPQPMMYAMPTQGQPAQFYSPQAYPQQPQMAQGAQPYGYLPPAR